MSLLTRKTVLQAKDEVTYGTAPSMDTSDAILISNLDISPDILSLERDTYRDTLSSQGHVAGRKLFTATFDVELKGIGSVPTLAAPLEYDTLLKACGLTVVYSGGGTYTPHSDDDSMVSTALKFNLDGQQILMTGAYGTFGLELVAGRFGVFHFEFTGLYNSPTDQTQISPNYASSEIPPICENATFVFDSFSAIVENWTINMNNEISERPDLNSAEGLKGLRITRRAAGGSIDPEMDTVANKDFWDIMENSEKKAMSATIGATAGNKFDISLPTVQIMNMPPGDRAGIRTYQMDYLATGDDNEFSFKGY